MAAESCLNTPGLRCDFARYKDFTGYQHRNGKWTDEGLRRREAFRISMRESRVSLCGESIAGVFPYRFFEAMSAGRVPFLISSNYVFPFADEIPYNDFILRAPREDARKAGQILKEFLRIGDAAIIEKGKQARHWWLKLLNSQDWPKTMAYAVTKAMRCT